MRKHIYTKNMELFLSKRNYIPRRIMQNEPLKLYKRYYCYFDDLYFKIDNIFYIGNQEYYSVKTQNLYYSILTEVNNNYIYEFMIDKNNIINTKEIINTNISYSGAEIRYWFFLNQDNIDENIFDRFYKFLDMNGKSVINDNKYYYLYFRNNDAVMSLDKERKIKYV